MGSPADLPVAVIGAGGSGLLAGAALSRAGVAFELLEARRGIGGTWRYDETGTGSACYASLVANTSKLRMSIGGRRIAGRPWQYAAHPEVLALLEGLASDAGLWPSIKLGWAVASAQHDGESWTLVSEDGERRRYRAVVCALPTNGRPNFATLPGTYDGEQLHSAAYRTPERFAGKDVLVLGLGTSGAEVAGDVAGVARTVQVSVRSPLWMMRRRLYGIPIDWLDNPWVARAVPWSIRRLALAGFCKATTGDLHRRGLPRPTRRCGDDIIAVSDAFPRAVRSGRIQFRPEVQNTEGHHVHFVDGTSADVDILVHATGYGPATDFLPEHARPQADRLFRGIGHTDAANLFFVGLFEAHRALLPVAEDQAAWVADVLAGRVSVPDTQRQRESAHRFAERRRREFGDRRAYMLDHARYRALLRRDRRLTGAIPS
jgi:cation diffusion facilitator CzcD-associated flavoprotein CzcO